MKILLRNEDHRVMYVGDDLILDSELRGDGWRDPSFNGGNAYILDATPPDLWSGGVWAYVGGVWSVEDVERHEAILARVEEEILAKAISDREAAKAVRAANVERIKVTTQSGKVFDGDEISQGRMARGILGLQAAGAPSVLWVLADNTPTQVTVEELGEALALAGAAQAAAWVI